MLDFAQIQSFYPPEIRPFKVNILREYLQHKILESLFRAHSGSRLIFMGGTCIHLLHGSPRFSEDLDFDNRGLSQREFASMAEAIRRDLKREGYSVELKTAFPETGSGAFRAFFRFPAILHESGLSGHREQKLLIQLDAESQAYAYEPQSSILNRYEVFCRIRAAPAGLLLAQKFLCILNRPRPLGRDFYDAAVLLAKVQPDLAYLAGKLKINSAAELKERVLSRCAKLDLDALAADILPFIVKPRDTERVTLFRDYVAERL